MQQQCEPPQEPGNVASHGLKQRSAPKAECRGCRYLVDTVAGDPEVLQADAETYYEKLLKQSSSAPDIFSIPGGEKFWHFI